MANWVTLADKRAAEEAAAAQNPNSALISERQDLALALELSYSPDDFPGSAGWYKCRDHEIALDRFDAEHPEILQAIKAEQAAKTAEVARNAGWI